MKFKLSSQFKPTGDQPQAIKKITDNIKNGAKHQVLLGVTGSGKTFTLAKVIEKIQKPTLIISHNKTLAAQLYHEFKTFFPDNAVKYFVSYYDFYQPEAYVPQTDTYIEKDAQINEEIDRLRNDATFSLMTKNDVIIVASVSCIYGLGNPKEYEKMHLHLEKGKIVKPREILKQLVNLRYERNDFLLERSKFSYHGEVLDIFPSYGEEIIRIEIFDKMIEKISILNAFTKEKEKDLAEIVIYPAAHFVSSKESVEEILGAIKKEMEQAYKKFRKQGKFLEAQRIKERTLQDLEMIRESGYCQGIENYSRWFDRRKKGEPPFCLLDYYPEDFLLVVDESHMTIPQIRGMYFGDRSRKETLVKYGFRLPSALDNRPLKFGEFLNHLNQAVYISATPAVWELTQSLNQERETTLALRSPALPAGRLGEGWEEKVAKMSLKKILASKFVTEQVIRPTYLVDPRIEVRPQKGQLEDLTKEIIARAKKNQRTLVTVLTKRLAEELADFLKEKGMKVAYLHSEIETLKRTPILKALREGVYDVLVGVNLLREGLDLPEVSLVAILDADKEGFLRSEWALIQTMGRAARHIDAKAILYADKITLSMKRAIEETRRRRKIQEKFNKKFGLTPKSIEKPIEALVEAEEIEPEETRISQIKPSEIPQEERDRLIEELTEKMNLAAENLEFERAAFLRDQIKRLKE